MPPRKFLPVAALLALQACASTEGPIDAPTFSPEGKFDGVTDGIKYLQDIGTNAVVRGRFQADFQYRGFTVFAEAGQSLDVSLEAVAEQAGVLTDRVDTQLMLYGPVDSPTDLFEDVLVDTGLELAPALHHDVAAEGIYLIVATRPEAVQNAQFELDVECEHCQVAPPTDDAMCVPGRLFVEGAHQRSQEWRKCEVIVLEPTRLLPEEELTIGPDVHVRSHYFTTGFDPDGRGETSITFDGKLNMESAAGHEIVFESNVPGKQWQGLIATLSGTVFHDFVMTDAVVGVDVRADSVAIRDGEISLGVTAVELVGPEADGAEIERMFIHDNDTGLDAHSNSALDSVFVLDSVFSLNDTAIMGRRLSGTFFDGLKIAHNGVAMDLTASSFEETQEPENWISISNSTVDGNESGIRLGGNGVIDAVKFENQESFAVYTDGGNHKVKNSLARKNAMECDGMDWGMIAVQNPQVVAFRDRWQACATFVADDQSRTVFRNNVVEHNFGHGVLLTGAEHERVNSVIMFRRDTEGSSILNSRIADNRAGGIALLDGPRVSIEFNEVDANASAFVLAFSNGRGTSGPVQPDGTRPPRWQVPNREHRIQRNNLRGDQMLRIEMRAQDRGPQLTRENNRRWSASRNLTLSDNFLSGTEAAVVEEEIGHEQIVFTPALTQPESFAGLIIPIDPGV